MEFRQPTTSTLQTQQGTKLHLGLFNRNKNKASQKQLFLSGAQPESFTGEADLEAIHDLCLIPNIML
jgi:hypothetical protein